VSHTPIRQPALANLRDLVRRAPCAANTERSLGARAATDAYLSDKRDHERPQDDNDGSNYQRSR